jgi:hypothetical protein
MLESPPKNTEACNAQNQSFLEKLKLFNGTKNWQLMIAFFKIDAISINEIQLLTGR